MGVHIIIVRLLWKSTFFETRIINMGIRLIWVSWPPSIRYIAIPKGIEPVGQRSRCAPAMESPGNNSATFGEDWQIWFRISAGLLHKLACIAGAWIYPPPVGVYSRGIQPPMPRTPTRTNWTNRSGKIDEATLKKPKTRGTHSEKPIKIQTIAKRTQKSQYQ